MHSFYEKNLQDIRVVGLGQASLDYLGRLGRFPEENAKVELTGLHIQCGGPASTALVTLSRLGVKTSFFGAISDDAFGARIKDGLDQEGVDATFLKVIPGFTSQYAFIAITQDSGNRTIFWHRGSTPPLMPEDIDLTPFDNMEVLHLDGLMIEASITAAREAKTRDIKIVMDAGTMREGSRELISMVDVLIASESFAESFAGKNTPHDRALEMLSRVGPEEVVITLGVKGSVGLRKSKRIHQAAYPMEAVDTTGAGDVYHGAYIFGLLNHWDMRTCMRFASATAAIKCGTVGARMGIPGLEQVRKFIAQYPEI